MQNLELVQRLQAHSPGTSTYLSARRPSRDASDDNIAINTEPSNGESTSRLDDDNISVISNAFSAIELASKLKKSSSTTSVNQERSSFRSSLQPFLYSSPISDALTPATKRDVIGQFIDEIVGLSEELQLYSKNPSQPQSPKQLAKITSTAMKLCDSLQPQQLEAITSPRLTLSEIESPIESFRDSIFSTLSKHSNSTDITDCSPTQPGAMERSRRFADRATSMVNEDNLQADLVEAPLREARREQPSGPISESGSFIMDIGPPAKQRLAFTVRLFEANTVGVAPVECTLDFAEANENTPFCSITAIAVNQRRKSSSRTDSSSIALTPQTHLDLPGNDEIIDVHEPREHKRIFHHKFNPNRRPFPHVLHPVVEGPDAERNAPYTITFTAPQHFEEEGVTLLPTRSTNLKYIFSHKEDRDLLQTLIFGKLLIFTAGIKTVVTTGPRGNRCDAQQALRLWLSRNGKLKSIIVYFKDGKHPQKLYKEYHVHSLQSDPRKLKDGAAAKVLVSEETSVETLDTRRKSSTTSAQTLSSKGSAESATSKLSTCSLHFSKDKDRADFLRYFT